MWFYWFVSLSNIVYLIFVFIICSMNKHKLAYIYSQRLVNYDECMGGPGGNMGPNL